MFFSLCFLYTIRNSMKFCCMCVLTSELVHYWRFNWLQGLQLSYIWFVRCTVVEWCIYNCIYLKCSVNWFSARRSRSWDHQRRWWRRKSNDETICFHRQLPVLFRVRCQLAYSVKITLNEYYLISGPLWIALPKQSTVQHGSVCLTNKKSFFTETAVKGRQSCNGGARPGLRGSTPPPKYFCSPSKSKERQSFYRNKLEISHNVSKF